jgi:ABC-type transport system involved in Fe-S cluster assembly fused permease/ATPase subunit
MLLAEADEVVLLSEGRVVSRGTHRDLLDHDAAYLAIVRRAEGES